MSYADVVGHGSMIFDGIRNAAYAAAIRRVITPDSVVLDLGAGLGVLGLIAAAAGARKVYLVEPESVVHAAHEVAKRNGYGDRVVALQGRIEDVALPEKVDVIISVFTGNLLYSEDLLPSLFFARDRWLKPGGHLIPDAAKLMAAPVSAHRLHGEAIGNWSTPRHGIDFGGLRRYAANSLYQERRPTFQPEIIATPSALVSADFSMTTDTHCDAEVGFHILTDADCSGVVAWIRIRLGGAWLGTGPDDPDVHWTPQLMLVDPELPVARDEILKFHLHRPPHGDWTWRLRGRSGQRRQSTFLAQALSNADLMKLAPDRAAVLGESGRVALDLLGRMNGSATNGQLGKYLFAAYPGRFSSEAAAIAFVRSFARKYAE